MNHLELILSIIIQDPLILELHLLKKIINAIKENNLNTTGQLLEHFRDEDEMILFSELAQTCFKTEVI